MLSHKYLFDPSKGPLKNRPCVVDIHGREKSLLMYACKGIRAYYKAMPSDKEECTGEV